MDEIEVTGKSIEEIVERAGQLLNCKPNYLEYSVLRDERKGRSREICCKVWKRDYQTSEAEEEVAEDQHPEDQQPGVETLSELAVKSKEILQELAQQIISEVTVSVSEKKETIRLSIEGDESGLIIGRRGQTLEALQHLVVKILAKGGKRLEKALLIDAEGYRQRRRQMLEKMADKFKKDALRSRKPIFAEPMSAYERRIIHLTLSKEKKIYTKSAGKGSSRHVVIVPRDYPQEKLDKELAANG